WCSCRSRCRRRCRRPTTSFLRVVDDQCKVLIEWGAISRHAVARDVRRVDRDGERTANPGRDKDALYVIPCVGYAARSGKRAAENITQVCVTSDGHCQIKVIDKRIAGGWPRRVSPGESNTERFSVIAYRAGNNNLLT